MFYIYLFIRQNVVLRYTSKNHLLFVMFFKWANTSSILCSLLLTRYRTLLQLFLMIYQVCIVVGLSQETTAFKNNIFLRIHNQSDYKQKIIELSFAVF